MSRKRSSKAALPVIIRITQEPPDKYKTGKMERSFPSFGPEDKKEERFRNLEENFGKVDTSSERIFQGKRAIEKKIQQVEN